MRAKGLFKFLTITLFLVVFIFTTAPAARAQGGNYLIFAYKYAESFDSIQWMIPGAIDTHLPLVTMTGANLNCPRVSNDNKYMAYIDDNTGAIYVMEIGVSGPVAIGNSVPAKSLAWSSDDTTIYFWGSDYVFYSIPAIGGITTALFGGQAYWAWFNDGGFEVVGVELSDEAADRAGTYKDYILAGATTAEWGKVNLIQLEVGTDPVDPVGVFAGLADNYTPSKGPVDGRNVWQADHDGAGSHRVYTTGADGTAAPLTELFSGSPFWNAVQTMFAYAHAGASTYGSTAYAGAIRVRYEEDGRDEAQFTYGAGRTPAFYEDLAPSH